VITFLASPKPFIGLSKEHQYRAVKSWLSAGENVEVILYGESEGIDAAGQDLGVKVVKQINCAPSGVPYFDSIVSHATAHGRYEFQVYLNCDILLSGILPAMCKIEFAQFLLIGQRIDLAQDVSVNLDQKDWIQQLNCLEGEGKATLHSPTGIDYFAFRRGMWLDLPPIIIGRGGYDNAIIAYCMRNRIKIVDGTFVVTALHQYHDYDHISGGEKIVMHGSDAMQNINQAGGKRSSTMVSDSAYVLKKSIVKYFPCRGDRLRYLELKLRYEMGWNKTAFAMRLIWRGLHIVGITSVPQPQLDDIIKSF
jgi:hypothetical protein